jgi:GPH family glycoside/pentoside/hexuronide:cation symporter
MSTGHSPQLPARHLIAYALPAFVIALPTIPVYIHLPSLYGVDLGVGLAATGLALLVARLFDVISDPIVGALCDRFGFLGLYRKPWIALGAVVAGLGLVQILNPGPDAGIAYLLGWSVVLYAGWTLVAVPYLAWGAELSDDYDQRTRIAAWRETLTLAGVIGAGIVAALTAQAGWSEARSIGAIAWLAIAFGALAVPLLLLWVPERVSMRRRATATHSLRSLVANRPFLRLVAAWFINGLANGVPAALFFIYLEYALGAEAADRPIFVLLYFAAAIVSLPVWAKLSRRFGKHRTWSWAMLIASATFFAVPLFPSGAFILFGIVCLITGAALGADLALPPAIQADVLDYDRWRFGQERAGIQFALWGMSTKFALALAVGLALPAVEIFGFDPEAPSEAGKTALKVIYAWVPAVVKLLAVAVVWNFPLTKNRQAAIRRRLRRAWSNEGQ